VFAEVLPCLLGVPGDPHTYTMHIDDSGVKADPRFPTLGGLG
jgi:hypothetical protein